MKPLKIKKFPTLEDTLPTKPKSKALNLSLLGWICAIGAFVAVGGALTYFGALNIQKKVTAYSPEVKLQMEQLAGVYRHFFNTKGTFPEQLNEFESVSGGFDSDEVLRLVRDGTVIATWVLATKKDEPEVRSRRVLAYQKDARDKGGLVIMGDFTVKDLSSSELNKALTAGST